MTPISVEEFSAFLRQHSISRASHEIGIGSQLTSDRHHRRIVTIHFAENEPRDYVTRILNTLFNLEPSWIIFPRYGSVQSFAAYPLLNSSVAATFSANDLKGIVEHMVSIQETNKVIEHDPYFLGSSGEIIATWDHHVFSDGFSVMFSDIAKSTLFISLLNEIGAEFEMYFANA